MIAGAIVTSRRTQRGMVKPWMITWPAIIPTVEADRPEARSDILKTVLAEDPSRGVRVR